MPTGRAVSKRGGRRETFSFGKLQRALERALESSDDLPSFASREIAESIERRLPFAPDRAIESSGIRAIVERVLEERGARSMLAHYRRFAHRRDRQRASLRVAAESSTALLGAESSAARGRAMTEAFDPARIATHLCLHRGLGRDQALEIAACVERRFLAARWTTIGRDLIAAAVNAECLAREVALNGAGASRRDTIGPRRSEVDELLEAGCTRNGAEITSWGQSVEQTLASVVLSRYATRNGARREAAAAHAQGDLHFLHLDAPHRRIAATALIAPDALDPALVAERLAEALGSETHRVGLLIDVRAACAGRVPWKRVRIALEEQLPLWSAIARAAGGRLGLGVLVPTGASLAEEAVRELVRALERPVLARPQVFESLEIAVPGNAASTLGSSATKAGAAFAFAQPPIRFSAMDRQNLGFGVLTRGGVESLPEPDRGGAWIWGACGGLALDLPRIAASVAPADEGAFFASLHTLLELGVDEAQHQIARHERRARAGLGPPLDTASGCGFAVVPIGFHEAQLILWGEVAAARAARALTFLAEALERFGRVSGTEWILELGDAPEVRARFERLDDAREERVGSSGYASPPREGRRYGHGVVSARGGVGPLDRHVPGLLPYGRMPALPGAASAARDLAPLELRVPAERRNEST